jgi:hypothetical protein
MMEPFGTQTCPQCDALSPQVGYVPVQTANIVRRLLTARYVAAPAR